MTFILSVRKSLTKRSPLISIRVFNPPSIRANCEKNWEYRGLKELLSLLSDLRRVSGPRFYSRKVHVQLLVITQLCCLKSRGGGTQISPPSPLLYCVYIHSMARPVFYLASHTSNRMALMQKSKHICDLIAFL